MTIVSAPAAVGPRTVPAVTGPFRHVLVCLDRTSAAESCFPYPRLFARAFGTKITLLHVMPSDDGAGREWSRPDALDWEIRRLEGDRYLRAARITLAVRGQDKTAAELGQGPPAERIVATAREIGADLTVLASHREDGSHGALLGATTQRVLALSHGSILLTYPGSPASTPPHRILVPLDGSTRAESVLPAVVALARTCHASVVLLHGVCDPAPMGLLSAREDFAVAEALATRLQASAGRYLAQVRHQILGDVPQVQTVVLRRTDLCVALPEAAVELRCDLVVVAAHGSTCNAARSYGSVSSCFLDNSRVPVLVLQDLPADEEPRRSDSPPRPSVVPAGEGF